MLVLTRLQARSCRSVTAKRFSCTLQSLANAQRHPHATPASGYAFSQVLHRGLSTPAAAAPPRLPHFFERVLGHQSSLALLEAPPENAADGQHREWKYAELLAQALVLRDELLVGLKERIHGDHNQQPRIAFLGERGASYVVIQWAIWLAGAIAVPLHHRHPVDELEYILSDSESALLIASESFTQSHLGDFLSTLPSSSIAIPVHIHASMTPAAADMESKTQLTSQEAKVIRQWLQTPDLQAAGAHIVYTSGTTGRPKGVVTTHSGLTAQIHDVVSAWEMVPSDHLLHFLPLHHVHGVLNNLLCVHYAGGSLEFLPSAQPELIWSKLSESLDSRKPVSMLMAVPTVYMLLLEEMERATQLEVSEGKQQAFSTEKAIQAARSLRVAISGSMACPVSILDRWQQLTDQQLLERYGMTELGMALTNPLRGERHFGYVGKPFPSVSVRLVDPETHEEVDLSSELEGELRVKGPTVFKEYWKKPEATAKEFDEDGWFKTGDIAQFSNERQSFRIRGRASADIIKSAGYKISALDIERVLLTHPQVHECAVFGMPDEKWGQIVTGLIRASSPSLETPGQFSPPLVEFLKSHLADYAVPRGYFFTSEIPKNAMGKVNKKSLATAFQKEKKTPPSQK